MDQAVFLETLTYAESPDLICGVKLVQLLCNHALDTARKTFRDKMKLPLMRRCPEPLVAADGHTHLIDKRTACLLITKLPDGRKGGKQLNLAGKLQEQFGELLLDLFDGDQARQKQALRRLDCRKRHVAARGNAADMIWSLLTWAEVQIGPP